MNRTQQLFNDEQSLKLLHEFLQRASNEMDLFSNGNNQGHFIGWLQIQVSLDLKHNINELD